MNDSSALMYSSLTRIAQTAKRLANRYTEQLGTQGFNLRNSSGAVAHQDVFHFHLHLVPRYEDDGLNLIAEHAGVAIDPNEVFEEIMRS